jgi:hypothetical protein
VTTQFTGSASSLSFNPASQEDQQTVLVSLQRPGQNAPAVYLGTQMHAKLTQAVAEKCEPNSGDYEIVDTLIPGLYFG